jgi:hypothetical protein
MWLIREGYQKWLEQDREESRLQYEVLWKRGVQRETEVH